MYDAEYTLEMPNFYGQELTVDSILEIRKQIARAGDEEPESETRTADLNVGSTYHLGIHG